ncbi:MAG: MMPL family transporter [Desulfuromonadales bacterium]|nr:MMPL family transporter [Desulfuromonadales bacterium]
MASWIADFCIRWRRSALAAIALVTLVLGYFALQVEVKTIFTDLQPSNHPYVQTNEEFKNTFGGANVVTIMVEPKEGDIFNFETLETIKQITDDLQYVDAVNQFQIVSLASKKLKNVIASNVGIESLPIMWPELPKNQDEIDKVRKDVISNPMVYGSYVSYDQKSALITVDFIDRLIEYDKVLPQIRGVIAKASNPNINIKVVGQPILAGLVLEYLPETLKIVLLIVGVIALILLISKGTLRGMLLPLFSGLISGIWIFGVMKLLDFNLDPLAIVITFIISARAISHAVQLNAAFNTERAAGLEARDAARMALTKLFRPGMLGLATDMGAMLVVAMTPIPLLNKAAIIGAMWIGAMVICTIIMIPVMLSWCSGHHEKRVLPWSVNPLMKAVLRWCGRLSTSRSMATLILSASLAVLLVSGYFAKDITIGDSNAGSPILWPESEYNQDDSAINSRYPGSDRMFLVVAGEKENTLKEPEVLENISRFQQYIEAQPEIGGTVSLADVIRPVNMILREGNPRYYKLGDDALINGEMLFFALTGSDPGDIDRFTDNKYQNGSVMMMFRDHKGDTIRKAIQAIKDFAAENPMNGASYRLAGGLVGVLAAVNEVIFSGQIQSIALALLLLFIFCVIAYRTTQAGLFFLPMVLLSNTITFSFMSLADIGLNINTLPVAALGIGLGVDYAFYITDRVKEGYESTGDLAESINYGLMTAGRGVLITAATMIASVVFWYFFSSLRFQAEMGLLIAVWMTVSAVSALLVIPSMIYLFKPRFILGNAYQQLEVDREVESVSLVDVVASERSGGM